MSNKGESEHKQGNLHVNDGKPAQKPNVRGNVPPSSIKTRPSKPQK